MIEMIVYDCLVRRPRSQSVSYVEQNQVGQKADRHAEKDFKPSLQRSFHIQSYLGHLTESYFQASCRQQTLTR